MQPRLQLTLNGQEVQQGDINLIAKEAALADDRLLAELLRLVPYSGAGAYTKAVIPYATRTSLSVIGTVLAGAGGVLISPFRAIVGSRTAAGTGALDNWQDVRSAIYTGSSTSLTNTISLTPNSTGNPRWDLIYAVVAIDAPGPSVPRYIKTRASTGVQSIAATLVTTVTVAVTTGTAAATPAYPTLAADAGGNAYIPLAYVRVPTGFTGASAVGNADVIDLAPVVPMSRALGVGTTQPADQNSNPAGTPFAAGSIGAFTATANTRSPLYLPPSMAGTETVLIAMDYTGGVGTASHASGSTVDASRDWRNRIFRWTALTGTLSGFAFDKASAASSQGARIPSAYPLPGPNGAPGGASYTYTFGFGQSFFADANVTAFGGASAPAMPTVLLMTPTMSLVANTFILYVDTADAGKLKVWFGAAQTTRFFIWLEASAPFASW